MKIYFDKSLIQKEYLSFLAPLLWCPDFPLRWEDKNQIKDRFEYGKTLLSFSPQETCDFFVYPKYFRLDNFDELKWYSNDAKIHAKKVLVFSYGEIDDYIDINENIVWYKRATKIWNPDNEYCLPPFPEDLLPYNHNTIPSIQTWKKHKYSLGYTWYSNYVDIWSFFHYLFVRYMGMICRIPFIKKLLIKCKKESIYGRLINAWIGNYCRWKTIQYIWKLDMYDFNFIQRRHALTTYVQKNLREEYIQNLIDTDFPLLVRWFGNYSIRHYEVLSLWKIPLYIDTWAKLPFDDVIPYDDIFIIVPFQELHEIGQYIDRYIAKNQWRFVEIQNNIRKIYETYFVMKNYYTTIVQRLKYK